MKRLYLFTLYLAVLLLAPGSSFGQSQFAFRISFTDKHGTTADISKPSEFLSLRALERRSNQSISIDSSDLPVVDAYVNTVLSGTGGILHSRSRWQNNCVILLADSSKMSLVRSQPFVKSTAYVAIFSSPLHLLKEKVSNPVNEKEQNGTGSLFRTTGSVAYYGDAFDQIKLANGDFLHDAGFRGQGKIIAVMDEGFYLTNTLPGFDSLRSSGRLVDTFNFNLASNSVFGFSAHGTEVLSTMAGILKGDYVGTAPEAMYALYVTENGPSEQPFEMDNLVAAMERADSIGADLISISLGYNTFNIGTLNADLAITDIDGKSTIAAMGANMATKKGILVVSSAGNEGAGSWGKILTPGDADSALTCGSVDINKLRAGTSGKGPNAAGVLKPDVCMLGAPGIVFNNSGTTSAVNGTSIATPELAGLAACLWGTNPKATPYQLREAIRKSAHIASGPNNELGYGVPDFSKARLKIDYEEIWGTRGFSISPNPVKDKVSVYYSGTEKGKLDWKMTDVLGKTLLYGTEQLTDTNFDFEIIIPRNLPSGMYLFHFNANGKKQTLKAIK